MSVILKIVALFTSMIFALSGIQESVIGFTDGTPIKAERVDYCFDNDRLLIGAYYAEQGKMKEADEAGIDFFITNNVNSELLDEAQQYGIGIIAAGYNLSSDYGTIHESVKTNWLNFDYAQNYKNHPALWGDDLIDEPGSDSFDDIGEIVKNYRSNNPDKFVLVNLFPNYANDEQLQETGNLSFMQEAALITTDQHQQFAVRYKKHISNYINKIDTDYICMDYYPYYYSVEDGKVTEYTSETWLRNLDVMAEACRETNRDFWVITQAAGKEFTGENDSEPRYCDSVDTISQQAYASLAFGAKAIIHAEFAPRGWWDPEKSHMIDSEGNTTKTYDAVRTVDGWLHAFAEEYGRYDYTSTYRINPTRIAGQTAGRLAVQKSDEAINLVTTNGIIVGTFTGKDSADGKAYIITNMEELADNVTATAKYTVPSGKTATVYQQGVSEVYKSGETIKFTFIAGDGAFMTVK